jgi:hypothetical protein
MKIVARLWQVLFGCVTVLRDRRRRRSRINDVDWMMMRGDDKQRVYHQTKQHSGYHWQPGMIWSQDFAVTFQRRSVKLKEI